MRLRGPAPEAGGPAEVMIIERASATPIAPLLRPAATGDAKPVPAPNAEPVRAPLSALEAWFSSVVTHPKSAAEGARASESLLSAYGARALEQIVTPGPKLSVIDRLGIYQYAYHARLVECLADDYPTVKHALGEQGFEALARRYIEANPSKGPNLNSYGKAFAAFAAGDRATGHHEFIAELARLEWALVEVLHARAEPTLSPAVLETLAPEAWPSVKLPPAATLRFEEFTYPANRYLQVVRSGSGDPELPAREWSGTAIYRRDFTVWRMDFTRPMARVLKALMRGETLGDALGAISRPAEGEDPLEASESDVSVWFREWVAGGFFARIVID